MDPAAKAAKGEARPAAEPEPVLECRALTVRYQGEAALQGIDLAIPEHRVTAVIGSSGCGKSTLLRQFNRLSDFVEGVTHEGDVLYRRRSIFDPAVDPIELRRQIGMVFQKPTALPLSIFENIAWAPRLNKLAAEDELSALVEQSLRQANLWQEVARRLKDSAEDLSGGQQQRLCIARAIAVKPEVILLDEPCNALDHKATEAIERLILELAQRYTIVLATHDLRQARRVSDYTAYLADGELVECGETARMFSEPTQQRTAEYVSGAGE